MVNWPLALCLYLLHGKLTDVVIQVALKFLIVHLFMKPNALHILYNFKSFSDHFLSDCHTVA